MAHGDVILVVGVENDAGGGGHLIAPAVVVNGSPSFAIVVIAMDAHVDFGDDGAVVETAGGTDISAVSFFLGETLGNFGIVRRHQLAVDGAFAV